MTLVSPNTIEHIQGLLSQSLNHWYPELEHTETNVRFCEAKEHRWSSHIIYEVKGVQGSTPSILVKLARTPDAPEWTQHLVRPTEDAQMLEYTALLRLYEQLDTQFDGITAVRPLAYFDDIDALAMEYMPGQNFLTLLLQTGRPWSMRSVWQPTVDVAHKAGQLLAAVHQIRHAGYPRKAAFDSDAYHAALREKIGELEGMVAEGHVRRRLRMAQEAASAFLPNVEKEHVLNYLHRDYYPKNVVCLPDTRVYTIDTTLDHAGAVEEDIAKFLVGLDTLQQRVLFGPIAIRSAVVHEVKRAFLGGYAAHAPFSKQLVLALKLVHMLQRWIEMLRVTKRTSPIVARTIERTRVTPFMLAYLNTIIHTFRSEVP